MALANPTCTCCHLQLQVSPRWQVAGVVHFLYAMSHTWLVSRRPTSGQRTPTGQHTNTDSRSPMMTALHVLRLRAVVTQCSLIGGGEETASHVDWRRSWAHRYAHAFMQLRQAYLFKCPVPLPHSTLDTHSHQVSAAGRQRSQIAGAYLDFVTTAVRPHACVASTLSMAGVHSCAAPHVTYAAHNSI